MLCLSSSTSSSSSRDRCGKFTDTCVCVSRTLICESVRVCHLLICAYLQIDQAGAESLAFSRDAGSFHENVLQHIARIYIVRDWFFFFIINTLYN